MVWQSSWIKTMKWPLVTLVVSCEISEHQINVHVPFTTSCARPHGKVNRLASRYSSSSFAMIINISNGQASGAYAEATAPSGAQRSLCRSWRSSAHESQWWMILGLTSKPNDQTSSPPRFVFWPQFCMAEFFSLTHELSKPDLATGHCKHSFGDIDWDARAIL